MVAFGVQDIGILLCLDGLGHLVGIPAVVVGLVVGHEAVVGVLQIAFGGVLPVGVEDGVLVVLGVFQLGFLVGPFGIGLADLFHALKLFVKTHCQTPNLVMYVRGRPRPPKP